MGVALGQLHAHRGQCAGCLEADDHRQQRSELGQQRHPVRHRHGIGHFVDARTAFLPEQFAGEEQHDDHQQPAEGTLQAHDHLRAHWAGSWPGPAPAAR
ncbi:hypothetical protein G6F62_015221 [Rhizopus arrhizus]|nr:hypothetical protein G6F62_015221 [Rhizopus arrhizus]